jgi:hypothetical protein
VYGKQFTQKIEKFVGFAPVMFMSHVYGGLQIVMDEAGLLTNVEEDNFVIMQFSEFFKKNLGPILTYAFPRTVVAVVNSIAGYNKFGRNIPLGRLGMMARFDTGGMCVKNL